MLKIMLGDNKCLHFSFRIQNQACWKSCWETSVYLSVSESRTKHAEHHAGWQQVSTFQFQFQNPEPNMLGDNKCLPFSFRIQNQTCWETTSVYLSVSKSRTKHAGRQQVFTFQFQNPEPIMLKIMLGDNKCLPFRFRIQNQTCWETTSVYLSDSESRTKHAENHAGRQ